MRVSVIEKVGVY